MALARSFTNVFKKGTLFSPSSMRYGAKCSVQCDRCFSTDIPDCISYKDVDLCIQCTGEVKVIVNGKTVLSTTNKTPTNITVSHDPTTVLASGSVTRMNQRIYKDTNPNNPNNPDLTNKLINLTKNVTPSQNQTEYKMFNEFVTGHRHSRTVIPCVNDNGC